MKGSIQKDAFVKKETVIFIGLAALIIGFLGGIVFSVYQSPSESQYATNAKQSTQQGQQRAQAGAIPPAKAEKIIALERELASNPEKVEAWINLGNEYFDTAQHEKAIKAYAKALELSPDNPNVLTDLGVMYRRAGMPEKAIETFDKALKADPKHEQARFNKGVVLMADLNDQKGAIKTWEELLQINPFTQAPNGQLLKDILEQIKGGN